MAAVVHLDTHAVVLLYAQGPTAVSAAARTVLEDSDRLVVSPMVRLEMQYLQEIGRLSVTPLSVLDYLTGVLPLSVCDQSFAHVARSAEQEQWTRDPFDRLIVAAARRAKVPLLSRDRRITQHYSQAFW